MGLLSKKEVKEYQELERFSMFLDSLLLEDSYISRKEYLDKYEDIKSTYDELVLMEGKLVLSVWCKQNKVNYKKLMYYLNRYKDVIRIINKHNEDYVNKHLMSDKEYLDEVLKKDDPHIKLDIEQRRAVLSDEDYTLIVAGAGSGKTTTIEAKVKYLVDKKDVDPNRILVISFTRKATQELKDRFKKLDLRVSIATFHSIGNTIIKEDEGVRHNVVDIGFMYKAIEEYLINKLDDEYFIKKILLFFASYLNIPFDDENITLLFKSLAANDTTTLRSDLATMLDEYQANQTKEKITIKAEKVRSIDECRIANFLYIKGLDYVYEPVYQHNFEDTTKPYCPDFLIKYKGENIYLEHFGISQSGLNNRYSEEELKIYKKHINDKILLHKKHGTKLIYTFSQYNDGRDLISHLEEELLNVGIKFDAKDSIEIYRDIAKKAEDKYFSKLIQLICNFINRFKVSNYDPDTKFDEWLHSIKSERTKLFLEVVKQCFHIYESKRLEYKAIDFEDMINNASNILDRRIKDHDLLPYDYIFVDEYQDVSLQRFDLCQKLSKASKAKIIAVGDDWQSIFRFSGAKIELFTNFEEKMGYAKILKITQTYRNSQELIDIAGSFVMANDKQIKKDLKSKKSIKDPVVLMSYDDSYEKDSRNKGPFYRMGEAIAKALDEIVMHSGEKSSVLLIGRYNFDGKRLERLPELFQVDNKGQVIYNKYPNLKISFLTAHASKGLGRDNVVVVNGKDDVLGFPSKIEDDPVMKLVIKEDENIDFEEERRLFYVALTRTKNRVYIVTPQYRPSKFILEIKDKFTNIILRGTELNPMGSSDIQHKCPICGYPLQRRSSNLKFFKATQKLWICSNDPEVCGFITNDLQGNKYKLSISKCPKCEDGYLIVKKVKDNSGRVLGCTNYKEDGTGCNFIMNPYTYTQNKKQILVDSQGRTYKREFKEELIGIINSTDVIYHKYPKFKFSFSVLRDFLLGQESKAVMAFKLYEEDKYGIYHDRSPSYVANFISALLQIGIMKKYKEGEYEHYELIYNELTDNQVMDVYQLMRM